MIGNQSELFSPHPDVRLHAALADGRRARRDQRGLDKRVREWPSYSPGALNAWVLMVTTKAPEWRDRYIQWEDSPLTLGRPHEGFFYPDPIGFWAEVRKWSVELMRLVDPAWTSTEALSLTTLLHMEDDAGRFDAAMKVCRPGLVLFLDEASWERSGLEVRRVAHHIADPYRRGKVYEGFWGQTPEGIVVGKSPQHPTMHNLYRAEEMIDFLRSAPVDRSS